MGGGKGGSTSTVTIPPEVLARYNAVNAQAEQVAKQPFNPYTGQFVSGLSPTQQAGILNTNVASGLAQPYFEAAARGTQGALNQTAPYQGAATAFTLAGGQNVGPLTQQQIQYYQQPITEAVINPTLQALQQQQGQQNAALQAQQIKANAFGGSRGGLEQAELQRQQLLGTSQALAPIYQQAYQNALQTATGQQGVVSADLARQLQTGQQMAGLGQQAYQQQLGAANQIAGIGTGAQAAALQGAQAQLAAGTTEQQTAQADLTARYNQYLQQQGYPFQVAQFLANIAEGTGALSGSTTTTTGGAGFFSDRRLKEDVKDIGRTHDGQPIYSYRYANDNDGRTQIGLMAQDVEKKHPHAVGVMGGYKTVDYKEATRDAERPARAMGGLIPDSQGGRVWDGGLIPRQGFLGGGLVDKDDWANIMAAQKAATGPFGAKGFAGAPGTSSYVPAASLHVPSLVTAKPPAQQSSGLSQAVSTGSGLANLAKSGRDLYKEMTAPKTDPNKTNVAEAKPETKSATGPSSKDATTKPVTTSELQPENTGVMPSDQSNVQLASLDDKDLLDNSYDFSDIFAARGGVIPRKHFHVGGPSGFTDPYAQNQDDTDFLKPVLAASQYDADQAEEEFKKNQRTAGGGGGGGGGLGDVFNVAAKIIPFFLNEGGVVPHRKGYQEAGVVSSDDTIDQPRIATPEENKAHTVAEAKRLGLDPDFSTKVIGGESGFRSDAAGDEGSSFGPAQLHYANMSEKYPHSGLGDAFTKATGLHASDPTTSKQQITFALEEAAKNGWGPWTVARNLMAQGQGRPSGGVSQSNIGRGSSFGDVFQAATPDFVPTSSNFWIPALSGIGSMLASRNPSLGGAIGEGLIGGVAGYETNKKMQMEQAKQLIDVVNKTYRQVADEKTGGMVAVNTITGQRTDPMEIQRALFNGLTNIGVDPKDWGIAPPAAPKATGTTTGSVGLPAKEGAPAAQPTKQSVQDLKGMDITEMNPNQLYEAAFLGIIPGASTSNFDVQEKQKLANTYLAKAQIYANNGVTEDKNTDLHLYQNLQKQIDERINKTIADQTQTNTAMRQQFTKERVDAGDKLKAGVFDAHINEFQRLADLGADLQTGPGTEAFGRAVNALEKLGYGRNLSPKWKTDAAEAGEALKTAVNDAFSKAQQSGLTRAAATSLKMAANAVPNAAMDPGAYFNLTGTMKSEIMREKKFANDLVNAPQRNNFGKYAQEWNGQKENDDAAFKRQSFETMDVNPKIYDDKPGYLAGLQMTWRDPETLQTFMPRSDPQRQNTDKMYAVRTPEEISKIPEGAYFVSPDGKVRRNIRKQP